VETASNQLHILFANNSRSLVIREGHSLPWGNALCKRALDKGLRYIPDVKGLQSQPPAVKNPGIVSYMSIPVRLDDGSLYGTLCAASTEFRELSPRGDQILQLFARLIAQQVQKEQWLNELLQANAELCVASFTDCLTGLPNRRAVFERLPGMFDQVKNQGCYMLVVFIDLDGFKQINDRYGHDAGDEFLCLVGEKLKGELRAEGIVGRTGGDEFVIAGHGPAGRVRAQHAVKALKARLAASLADDYRLHPGVIQYPGASIGAIAVNPAELTPEIALRMADKAMYQDKNRRRKRTKSPADSTPEVLENLQRKM